MPRDRVVFPAPDIPVSQSVKPLCILSCRVADNGTVRREMDAALPRPALFPPPTAGALALARLNCASTRRAADTGESASVERMHRNAVGSRVFLHLGAGPIRQRIQLQASAGVLDLANVGARLGLLPPQSGRPRLERRQLALERLYFANLAAHLARGHAAVEKIG